MILNDADAYHFEIQFRLPKDQKISSEENEIALGTVLGRDRLSLKARDVGKLREAIRLSLLGLGYETITQAHDAAEWARRALVVAAIESGVAIEWRVGPRGSPKACRSGRAIASSARPRPEVRSPLWSAPTRTHFGRR